ncbi:MAG: hypothetical protein IID31_09840 [Planctomycetes bacterium]|nr:hypothetical protein [Planctomycetota bacterium]
MNFGTDFQIWDNFGLPASWRNMTSAVGAAPTTGVLPGLQPPPITTPWDGFSTLAWEDLTLDNGASVTLSFSSLYGTDGTCVPACPCACDFDPDPLCDIFDFLAFQNLFVLGDPCACDMDPDPLCDIFDFLAFQNEFVRGCP